MPGVARLRLLDCVTQSTGWDPFSVQEACIQCSLFAVHDSSGDYCSYSPRQPPDRDLDFRFSAQGDGASGIRDRSYLYSIACAVPDVLVCDEVHIEQSVGFMPCP